MCDTHMHGICMAWRIRVVSDDDQVITSTLVSSFWHALSLNVRTSLNVRHHLSLNMRGSNIFIFRDREFLTISLFLIFSLSFWHSLYFNHSLYVSCPFLSLSPYLSLSDIPGVENRREASHLYKSCELDKRPHSAVQRQHTATTHCNTLQQPATTCNNQSAIQRQCLYATQNIHFGVFQRADSSEMGMTNRMWALSSPNIVKSEGSSQKFSAFFRGAIQVGWYAWGFAYIFSVFFFWL